MNDQDEEVAHSRQSYQRPETGPISAQISNSPSTGGTARRKMISTVLTLRTLWPFRYRDSRLSQRSHSETKHGCCGNNRRLATKKPRKCPAKVKLFKADFQFARERPDTPNGDEANQLSAADPVTYRASERRETTSRTRRTSIKRARSAFEAIRTQQPVEN